MTNITKADKVCVRCHSTKDLTYSAELGEIVCFGCWEEIGDELKEQARALADAMLDWTEDVQALFEYLTDTH